MSKKNSKYSILKDCVGVIDIFLDAVVTLHCFNYFKIDNKSITTFRKMIWNKVSV